MPLEEIIDSIDSVDEQYRGLYVEKDGKFEIDISGLQSAYKKEKDLRKALQGENKEYKKTISSTKSADDMVSDLKTMVAQRDAKLQELTLTSELKKAALNAGIMADYVDDAVAITKHKFKLDDGVISVLDDNGDPTGSTPGTFFGGAFKKSKPIFYNGDGMEGSGTPPHSGPGRSLTHEAKMSEAFKKGDAQTLIRLETSKLNK